MNEKQPLITNREQVLETISRFHKDLSEHYRLPRLLALFRAWYYDPDSDNVGPSKFIGYTKISAEVYNSVDLDGRETESVLRDWFDVLEEGTPEYRYVRDKVLEQNASFQRNLNVLARFCAPPNWKSPTEQRSSYE